MGIFKMDKMLRSTDYGIFKIDENLNGSFEECVFIKASWYDLQSLVKASGISFYTCSI